MEQRNVVDVSSFMLFEATGDSEADSVEVVNTDVVVQEDNDNDDDDAQSCSCDLLDDHCGPIVDQLGEFDHSLDEQDDDDDDVNDDNEVIHQDWTDDDDDDDDMILSSTARVGQHKKARVCVGSTMELMSEVEKSRLFWEACLAS